jgi:hypothetical protein
MNSRQQKTIITVLFAPVAAGLLMSLILPIMEAFLYVGWLMSLNLPLSLPEPLYPSPVGHWVIVLSIFIGIPATLIIGVPVHALMVTMRWKRWWSYAIAGTLCGIAFAVVEIGFPLLRGVAALDCEKGPGEGAFTLFGPILDLERAEEIERFRTRCNRAMAVPTHPGYGAVAMIVAGVITAGLCWLIRRPNLH